MLPRFSITRAYHKHQSGLFTMSLIRILIAVALLAVSALTLFDFAAATASKFNVDLPILLPFEFTRLSVSPGWLTLAITALLGLLYLKASLLLFVRRMKAFTYFFFAFLVDLVWAITRGMNIRMAHGVDAKVAVVEWGVFLGLLILLFLVWRMRKTNPPHLGPDT